MECFIHSINYGKVNVSKGPNFEQYSLVYLGSEKRQYVILELFER